MYFRFLSAAMLSIAVIFSISCESTQEKSTAADPKLKDQIIDHKEFYDDGTLKGEGKVLYKIVMNKPKLVKQQKWTYYFQNKTPVKMSEGNYLNDKQDGKWVFYYPKGGLKQEGAYSEGLNTGEWKSYFETGEVFWTGSFVISQQKDDISGEMKKVSFLEGKRVTYFKDGKIQMEEEYKADKKNGRTQVYYPKGSPKEISMFKDGKKNGALNEWFENGKKKTEGFFTDDLKTGSWKMYYDNGQVMMEGKFTDDKTDGLWKTYSREGLLMKEGKYAIVKKEVKDKASGKMVVQSRSKEDGLWKFYEYVNGKKNLYAEYAVEGGMVTSGINKIYENGVQTGEGILSGNPKGLFQIIKNGQPGEIIDAANQPEDDPAKNITSKWTGKWKPLKKSGKWTEFYPGTKNIKFTADFMIDKKSNDYKEYYPNGKIKAEGKYLNDKKNGQWKFYNADGSVDQDQSGNYMMDKRR
jgi:antitoxin component YwqK of YwqJK toxin-antitoxin module